MTTLTSMTQDTGCSQREPTPHRLRLAPVPRLRGPLVRLMAWAFRRQMGKTMTPITVIYARWPRLIFRQLLMYGLAESPRLDKELVA